MVDLTPNLLGEIKCTKTSFSLIILKGQPQIRKELKKLLWTAEMHMLPVSDSSQTHPCSSTTGGFPASRPALLLSMTISRSPFSRCPNLCVHPVFLLKYWQTPWGERNWWQSLLFMGSVFVPLLAVSLVCCPAVMWADSHEVSPGCPYGLP